MLVQFLLHSIENKLFIHHFVKIQQQNINYQRFKITCEIYTRSDINEKDLALPRARYVCKSILTLPFTFTAEP